MSEKESKILETTLVPERIENVENPNSEYICYQDVRFKLEDGKYVGWYRP